jgi:hypothetical protein
VLARRRVGAAARASERQPEAVRPLDDRRRPLRPDRAPHGRGPGRRGPAAGRQAGGLAAWKTLLWEGELAPGQTVLVLGATGTSGRIATQLATRRGARVVATGRNQAIAAEGPYDLIVDYLWGPPAEAVFAAVPRAEVWPTSIL